MQSEIRKIRTNIGLTQNEFSNIIGVPVKTLRNWEQMVRQPNKWTLDLIIDRVLNYKKEEDAVFTEETGILSFLSIKKTVSKIASLYDISSIYLFGSYVKGNARENSDIDLYMESNLYGLDYFGFIEELRENLHKKVDLLSNKTIFKDSKIEQEIMKTGVLIYER